MKKTILLCVMLFSALYACAQTTSETWAVMKQEMENGTPLPIGRHLYAIKGSLFSSSKRQIELIDKNTQKETQIERGQLYAFKNKAMYEMGNILKKTYKLHTYEGEEGIHEGRLDFFPAQQDVLMRITYNGDENNADIYQVQILESQMKIQAIFKGSIEQAQNSSPKSWKRLSKQTMLYVTGDINGFYDGYKLFIEDSTVAEKPITDMYPGLLTNPQTQMLLSSGLQLEEVCKTYQLQDPAEKPCTLEFYPAKNEIALKVTENNDTQNPRLYIIVFKDYTITAYPAIEEDGILYIIPKATPLTLSYIRDIRTVCFNNKLFVENENAPQKPLMDMLWAVVPNGGQRAKLLFSDIKDELYTKTFRLKDADEPILLDFHENNKEILMRITTGKQSSPDSRSFRLYNARKYAVTYYLSPEETDLSPANPLIDRKKDTLYYVPCCKSFFLGTQQFVEDTTIAQKSLDDFQILRDSIGDRIETNPEFPGGESACMQWLAQNIKYPSICIEQGIQGRVYVQFIVEKDGFITNIKAVKSPSPFLSKEAIRLVKQMPRWKPGTVNGVPVRIKFTLPIKFLLTSESDSSKKKSRQMGK